MYALALLMSAGTTAATAGLPFFHLGAIEVGIPIQWFGMIVAVGVLIGATPLRRYAEWHGVSDENIRSLLTWVMVSGFLGAHEFDMIAYQWDKIGDSTFVEPASWWFLSPSLWPSNWPLPLRIWDGISSYGGFIGGSIGFALYVWWKRLPVRLFADITIVGLLPAFSIGRIGCTVVSDHIGAAVGADRWYAFLAMNYPIGSVPEHVLPSEIVTKLHSHQADPNMIFPMWNLGLIEFLYLVPVNLLILWLAFRPSKRSPAGFVTVLTGVLYAPVRFFLDFLRPEDTDPRYLDLTFAQWSSILAFGVAVYAAIRILKTGSPAETVAPTSKEAQERLRVVLRDDAEQQQRQDAEKKAEAERKKAEIERARAEREREDAEAAEAEAAERGKAALAGKEVDEASDDAGDDASDETEGEKAATSAVTAADTAKPAARPVAGNKQGGNKQGGNKQGGNKQGGNKAGGNKNQNKNRKR
jgi:phosphatidylglycerol---prolipoprotein diacylglyceryl transferase